MHRPYRRWLMILLGLGSVLRVMAASDVEALLILVGDQHSAYARTAQFVAHVDRIKTENPATPMAVLINGDSFEYGNAIARRTSGAIDLAMLAALVRRAPTILNLGNHEPEFDGAARTVERLRATGVVVVGNLRNRATGELFAPAATRLQLGRANMVITGITTDDLSQYRAPVRPTLDLAIPAAWAEEMFPKLLSEAPIKILLSHVGLRHDRGVFAFVPEGALIAGAHDHTRYVERMGKTVYIHSGSWNSHLSVVRLRLDEGAAGWDVEQREIRDDDPADPELRALIRVTEAKHLTDEDLKPVGKSERALGRREAARFVVEAVRRAANVDAAFIGNTTFGGGLPHGEVTEFALNSCVRFDGTVWVTEVTGERLRALLAKANQGPATPFSERTGEFQFACGPAEIEAGQLYRIATNDWGVRNRKRYFGDEEIVFVEQPGLTLKSIVAAAIAAGEAK